MTDHWSAEVEEIEVLGHPCLSYRLRPPSLAAVLEDAQAVADRTYLVQGERRMTFEGHDGATRSAAAHLAALGVEPGDRVLLLGANSIEWVVAFWAIVRLGAIVVLGNAWWSNTEVGHALAAVGPRLTLVDERRRAAFPAGVPHLGLDDLRTVDSTPPPAAEPAVPVAEDDPAIIVFTSGTTGLPKGAVLSHRGVVATLQSLLARINRLPVDGREPPPPSAALQSLPLFHLGGLAQIIPPLVTGGTIVLIEGRFDPARVVPLIEREHVRVWSTVPTMASRLMDHLEESGHGALEGLRTVGLGGSPVGEHLRGRVRRWFPNTTRGLAVTYGLSEAGGVVTTAAGNPILLRPGTVGTPLATATVRIQDPDEAGSGEVLVRSPSVMLGYWLGPDSSSIDPGPVGEGRWLRTGDIGRLDDEGYLFITDRSKDIVIRGGENIATSHVEDVLASHPAVRAVAVVGLPHASLGEELGAAIVLAEGATTSEADLVEFAKAGLAYFEVPTAWQFVDELPENSTGKVVKRAVRDSWPRPVDTSHA